MSFLPFVALGAKVGGDLLKGISSAESASYQAQVARNNAQIERQNAAYSAGATAADTERAGLEARAKLGGVRTALAANNLSVNSGSAANVQIGQRMLGNLDTATVASRGAREVYGYQTKATSFQSEANLKQAEVIPDIAGGVLGAAGDVASGWKDLPIAGGGGLSQSALPSDYTTSLPDSTSIGPSMVESAGGGLTAENSWMGGNSTVGEFVGS